MIAVPWLVLTTTGSATDTGLVAMAEMLPYVTVKALGGPIIDRVGPKHVAVMADLCSVFVVGAIAALHLVGLLSMPALIAMVILMGAVRGPSDGAKEALIPRVTELAEMPLERVTGVAGVIERLAGTVGAALAGGVVALTGPANALAIDAGTFAVAAALIGWYVPSGNREAPDASRRGDAVGYMEELREGWQFQRHDAVLMGIAVMVALTNLLDQAWTAVLVPVWAHHSGAGVGAVGLVLAVLSGASVLGSAVATWKGERMPRLPIYVGAFLVVGLPRFAVFAFDTPMWLLITVIAIGGFGSGFINPILSAVEFERIPERLLGRVSTLHSAMSWSLIPFGGLVGGLLVAAGGLPAAMLACGLGYFVVTLTPLARKSFREFDRRPSVDDASRGKRLEPVDDVAR